MVLSFFFLPSLLDLSSTDTIAHLFHVPPTYPEQDTSVSILLPAGLDLLWKLFSCALHWESGPSLPAPSGWATHHSEVDRVSHILLQHCYLRGEPPLSGLISRPFYLLVFLSCWPMMAELWPTLACLAGGAGGCPRRTALLTVFLRGSHI